MAPVGSSWLRLSILLALCLSNAFYTVIRKQSVGSETVPTEEVVFGSEIVKIFICMYYVTTNTDDTTSSGGHGITKLIWLINHSSKMIVIAVCYLIMNILSFLCLNYIGSGEFTVYSQLKILTTAIFSTIILQTTFSQTKWRALYLLVIGCILVASPAYNYHGGNSDTSSSSAAAKSLSESMLGYIMTIIQVILSGFVTIYFEKVVKSKVEIITVWERNFQLSFWSLIFCIILKFFPSLTGSTSPVISFPFINWSMLTFIVMILGSINGLLVAATLKYADSIMKVLAQAGAIIIAATLGYLFQGDPMDIFVLLGCLTSILAIMNYTFDESSPSSSSSSTLLSPSSSSQSLAVIASNSPMSMSPSRTKSSALTQYLRNNKSLDDDEVMLIDRSPSKTSIV